MISFKLPRKKLLLWLFAMIILIAGNLPLSAANPSEPAIIPRPMKMKVRNGLFRLAQSTTIFYDKGNPEMKRLAELFYDRVRFAAGPVMNTSEINPGTEIKTNSMLFTLTGAKPDLGDEGYELQITKDKVILRADKANGIFYGIQTMVQLLPPEVDYLDGYFEDTPWAMPCVEIRDAPRFPYRGLHLDVGRHLFPEEFIKEYIDLLAMYKMNTFHWHLTEDQGWRIEIKKYPLLTRVGAVREGTQTGRDNIVDNQTYGGFYSQEVIRQIVKYAADRYINIIPEIEMPGHSMAALASYPQYSCTGGPFKVRTSWGVSDDIYCAGNDSTFSFLEDILTEVMELFPSKYIHIGGDEAPRVRWQKCTKCQQRIKDEHLKNESELQSYFIRRIEKFLNSKGRKLIGWDEILEGGLAPEATVMSWRGIDGGIEAAKQNHDVIMTPGTYCYFDHCQANPAYEPLCIGGYTTLQKVYSYEPIPHGLKKKQTKHILGAQGNVWTEYLERPENVEYMAYPRAIALAEVDWSSKKHRDWEDFVMRLNQHFKRLDYKHVNYCKSLYDVEISPMPDPASGSMKIALSSDRKDMNIHYTTDGSDPVAGSPTYDKPFSLDRTSNIKARLFNGINPLGRTTGDNITIHKAFGKTVKMLQPYNKQYPGKGDQTLVDGLRGTLTYQGSSWLGFLGNDMEVVIDMGSPVKINSIEAGFLKNTYSWIFLPVKVEYSISNDGNDFVRLGTYNNDNDNTEGVKLQSFAQPVNGNEARYIKVKASNVGKCPPWHSAAGEACWLFVDEIIVD